MSRIAEHLGLPRAFSDGWVRELDFASALPGILASIDDDTVFASAEVDQVAGTVCWPNGIDLDPDVLHGAQTPASAQRIRVVHEYRLQRLTGGGRKPRGERVARR